MDPPTLMNQGSFPNDANANANATAYNLSEIWQFPINGGTGVEESGGGLGLRMAQFAHNLGQFGEISMENPEVSRGDPVSQRVVGHGHGGSKKRRDAELDSAKASSTSNGNNGNSGGAVFVSSPPPLSLNDSQYIDLKSVFESIMELVKWNWEFDLVLFLEFHLVLNQHKSN